jgi:hypothetical protein
MRRFRDALSVIAVAVGFSFAQEAGAALAWTFTAPSEFRNDSYSFGEVFTVGPNDITVTALGAYDAGLNGFLTPSESGGIPAGIYNETTNALLASTNVLGTDPLANHFRFHAIAPLVLLAGQTYRVVAVNELDLYNITDFQEVVNPAITRLRHGACATTTLTKCDDFADIEPLFFANFQFDVAASVPEPATLGLMALALLAMGYPRRRKSAGS